MSKIVDLHAMPELASLDIWKSPNSMESVYKNIPIEFLTTVRALIRKALENTSCGFIVRFQGPRYDRHKMSTMKEHATHFAIYVKPKKPPKWISVDGHHYQLVS